MSSLKQDSKKDFFENPFNNDDIDLTEIFNTIIRKKILVASIALIAGLSGAFFSLTLKKTWQGQFKIVLYRETENKSRLSAAKNLLSGSALLMNQLGSSLGGNSTLNTEIEILRSPSVLMPIFQYVIREKSKNEQEVNKIKINDWIERQLEIKLKRGTTVLDVKYKDNDKTLIKPVLEKISAIYQEYSSKNKKINSNQNLKTLSKEISKYKLISKDSFKKAQEYALKYDLSKYDLGDIDIISNANVKKFNLNQRNKQNVETNNKFKFTLREEIRNNNSLIEYIKNIDNNSPQLKNIIYLGPPTKTAQRIEEIDVQISKYKSILNENDKDIKDLERSKQSLLETLKFQTLSYLEGEKARLLSEQESLERPPEITLKFKSLSKEAMRDELTLNTLESEYRLILLQQARDPNPWKLITDPTVLDYPVAPNKKIITLIFTFFGLFFGIAASLIQNTKENIAYEKKAIERIMGAKIIFELNSENREEIEILAKLISKKIDKEKQFSKIITTNSIEKEFIKNFEMIIKKYLKSKDLKISSELISDENTNSVIIFMPLGLLKYSYLKKIKSFLEIQKINIDGIILVK